MINLVHRLLFVAFYKTFYKESFYQKKEQYLYDSRDLKTYLDRPTLINIIDNCFSLYDSFCRINKNNKNVLDIGCNTGHVINLFSEKYPEFRFTGFDINLEAINIANANKKSPGIKFLYKDILTLEEYDEQFDIIICFDILEHLCKSDNRSFFKNVNKLLSKGGLICFASPNGHTSDDGFHHMQFFTLNKLELLLKKYFKIIYIGKSGYNPILKREHDFLYAILYKC
jgi:2-polyprenyl-3-methyl-5-hydroxy-6-metoxy-1,4-benzoquinol methylase